jgi:hypothetical protein
MTPSQLKLVHTAKRLMGLDDADYRTILRSLAGVGSSKDLTIENLEIVMAHFESMGFRDARGKTYWRDLRDRRNKFCSPQQEYTFRQLIAQTDYDLDGFVNRMSKHRTREARYLYPWEAKACIDALHDILDRVASPVGDADSLGAPPLGAPIACSGPSPTSPSIPEPVLLIDDVPF